MLKGGKQKRKNKQHRRHQREDALFLSVPEQLQNGQKICDVKQGAENVVVDRDPVWSHEMIQDPVSKPHQDHRNIEATDVRHTVVSIIDSLCHAEHEQWSSQPAEKTKPERDRKDAGQIVVYMIQGHGDDSQDLQLIGRKPVCCCCG